MSNLKTKRVQIGDHSTATNNFVMHQSDTPDGKVHISNGTLDSHTSKMTLAHDGKLGVGTTSPTSGLDIQTDTNPVMKVSRGTNNSANINLYYNTTFTGQVSGAASGFQLSSVGSSTPMQFYTNGSKNMEIDPSGRVTKPSQPSCYVRANSGGPWETSDVVIFNGVDTNIGNCYNTSNGRFTAPINGRYMFSFIAMAPSFFRGQIRKNGAAQTEFRSDHDGATALNYVQKSITVIYSMSVGDYVDQYISAGSMNGNGNEVQMHAHLLS